MPEWSRIKIKQRCQALISKLKIWCLRFLKPNQVKKIPGSRNMTLSPPSLSRKTPASNPMTDAPSSHSSTQLLEQITPIQIQTVEEEGGSPRGDPSPPTSAPILQNSERSGTITSGKMQERNSGMTPAESRERVSGAHEFRRRSIDCFMTVSLLGLKVLSLFLFPISSACNLQEE